MKELTVLWGNQSALKYFAKLNFLCSNWPWDVRCRKVAGKRHLSNQYFILCSKYQWMVAIKASVLLSVRKYTSFKTFHLTFEVKVSITPSFPSFILSFGVPVLSKFTWREYFSWLTRTSHAYLLFHQKIVNIEWALFFSLEHSGCQLMWNGQKANLKHSSSLCLLKLVKEKKVHTQDLPSCGENRIQCSGRAASLAEPPQNYQET